MSYHSRKPTTLATSALYMKTPKSHPYCSAAIAAGALLVAAVNVEATTYTNNVIGGNWSSASSWLPSTGTPGASDNVLFNNAASSSSSATVNSIVDAGFGGTITGLSYQSTISSDFNVTQINSPQVLNVTGPFLAGGVTGTAGGTEYTTATTTWTYFTGTGTLNATGPTFTVQDYGGVSGANAMSVLNLSGLNNFSYNNSAGIFSVCDTNGANTRMGAKVYLAGVSNYICAASMDLGIDNAQQAGTGDCTLYLGAGTNVFNVGNLLVCAQKQSFQFTNSLNPGSGYGLKIRGVSGADTDRSLIVIANHNSGGGSGTITGSMILNGCPVDIKASTLVVGADGYNGGADTLTGNGTLSFDTGTIDTTSLLIANSGSTAGHSTSAVNVGAHATLVVGAGGVSLVNQAGSGTLCNGTLSIATGGTLNSSGSITNGNASTSGTSTLNLGGTLNLASGATIGANGYWITTFNISNNTTLSLGLPSASVIPVYATNLSWPSPDSTFTVNITALPAGVTAGTQYVFMQTAGIIGQVNGNAVVQFPGLPSGYAGTVTASGNQIILTITAVPSLTPSAPTGLHATAGNAQVSLGWNSVTGSSITYNILRSTTSGQEVQIASGITGTTYVDATANNGTSYYYEVEAEAQGNSSLVSPASNEVNASPVGQPPAVTGVTASLVNGQMYITWVGQDATSYNVLRSTSPNGTYTTLATGLTTTSYTDTTITPGTQNYYYEIVSVNGYGPTNSSPTLVPYGMGNQLADPGFESAALTGNTTTTVPGWTTSGGNALVKTTNATDTYYNSATGECPMDATALPVQSDSGTNVANIYGAFSSYPNTSYFRQVFAAGAGDTWTAGGYAFASHEDLPQANTSFHYEVDYLNATGGLLAAYESFNVANLTCTETTPFPVDTWVYLGVTNEMQVANGVNTGVVIGNTGGTGGELVAPTGTASIRFQAMFTQSANTADGGSMYLDDMDLDLVSGPVPPVVSALAPNGVTLATNTALTCTAVSSATNLAITNVVVITQTTPLGSSTTTTTTNKLGAAGLNVTGIGTHSISVAYTLTPNTYYNNAIVYVTDANGSTSASDQVTFDTYAPALVIEAADFNYSSGQFHDTPGNGGVYLYAGDVGTAGVDEYKQTAFTGTKDAYRTNDAVAIQVAYPNTFIEQKFAVAYADGITNYGDGQLEVGNNTSGDWLNYTRTYGPGGSAPAGSYNIYLYSANTGGGGVQADLYQVSGDPTTTTQTESLLGSFGTASYANDNYFNYVYLPLTDAEGNLVTVDLSGVQTLKSVVVGATYAPNLAYYMLIPSTSPSFLGISPEGPFGNTSTFTFTVTNNGGASIPQSDIGVVLNGVNITADVTFTKIGGSWVGTYTGLVGNTIYEADISVTNSSGATVFYGDSFDTFSANDYQVECNDYDFSTNNGTAWISGLFIDNPVPTGDTQTLQAGIPDPNSYYGYPMGFNPGFDPVGLGAVAQQGIDINFTNTQSGTTEWYRVDGVGSQPATDFIRPKFVAAQQQYGDPNIGPFEVGYFNLGNWLNYTRHYPTNSFYVYARLAGGNGPFSGTTLSRVMSGVGTANQTVQVLGSFADANPAGWQVYHWVPLRDSNNKLVTLSLGGLETLRLTSGNNLNAECFLFVPAPIVFSVTPALVNGQLSLSFPTSTGYNYVVLKTTNLAPASWSQVGSTVTGDGNTHSVNESLGGTQGFFTVEAQKQ